jgi:hypothetical protein
VNARAGATEGARNGIQWLAAVAALRDRCCPRNR